MLHLLMLVLYLLLCALIGFLGRNRLMGFWGYFFGSVLLTPIVSALLVLVSKRQKSKQ